jgi:hypothetical protein
MAIKKHKSYKNSKSKKFFLKYSKKMRTHRKTKSRHSNKKRQMKGGFSGCGIATVNEPGFSIPALGSIVGMSYPETRAAIYRPNCKTDTNQAMTP